MANDLTVLLLWDRDSDRADNRPAQPGRASGPQHAGVPRALTPLKSPGHRHLYSRFSGVERSDSSSIQLGLDTLAWLRGYNRTTTGRTRRPRADQASSSPHA